MIFDEFDCGCDNRREVMGAGDWQNDAMLIAAAVVVAAIIFMVTK